MGAQNLERKRWLIAAGAVVMQLCLGTVYAWSVFKKPLMTAHGWSETATQATFMILMAVIGTSAVFGGTLVDKKGPRFVATVGGYSLVSEHSLLDLPIKSAVLLSCISVMGLSAA